ncbi:MAG: LysM peptidoglycan-binding domain-containing protein [Caldilineaceae bacterium]
MEHAQGTINGNQYYVVRGDTIFSIARRFGVSEYELMRVNGVHNPHFLRAGSC